jgi:predicted RND superfamily exporter protein
VRAFVRWTIRYGRLLWLLAVLLAVPAALRTVHLYANLRSEVEELLPLDAPSVRALDEMRSRFRSLQFLSVVALVPETTDLPNAERFMDDLAARIRGYPKELVSDVRATNADVTAFVERHAGLYVDLADLRALRERIEARRDYEVAKESGELLDETAPPPSVDTTDLEAKYRARASGEASGHFSSEPLKTTMLFIEAGDFGISAEKSRALLQRVQADVASLVPSNYVPGIRVGYASDIAVSAEELEALQVDLSLSSVLVIVAVVGAILFYYRWWGSVPALLCPLFLAVVYAFGLASLPPFNVKSLNSSTAFLGSIIIGNGINVGLILLARYREERARGAAVEDALVTGVWGARLGTLVAAAAASASYGSLVVTDFRGFRQFGCIGGIGMLMSWATAFVLMPPLLRWLDRKDAPASQPVASRRVFMHGVATFVSLAAPWILVAVTALTVASAVQASRFDRSHLEYDLTKLRRVDTWKNGEGFWGRKMDAALGHYLTPTMLLFDTAEQTRSVEKLVRDAVARGPLEPMVARVVATDDVLPTDQEAKLDELRKLRRMLTPRIRAFVPSEKREVLDKILLTDSPIRPSDLPRPMTVGLRESDGTMGRTLLVYPKPSDALWKADSIRSFVDTLRKLAGQAPEVAARPGRVAGSIPLSDDILASIERDAPIASAVSFVGVVLMLVLLDRRVAARVAGALALGVLWLVGSTLWLGIKVNFSNFIALPITFGIGVDYAVNVMNRYVQDGSRDIGGAVRSTGGAVALCSLTTIIGYSSLLLAKNRALFLFGLVAVIGEIACLTAAVIALPAFLVCEQRLRAKFSPNTSARTTATK